MGRQSGALPYFGAWLCPCYSACSGMVGAHASGFTSPFYELISHSPHNSAPDGENVGAPIVLAH